MNINLENKGIIDLRFRVLREDVLPNGFTLLKSLTSSTSKKGIKTEISPESIMIPRLSPKVCKSTFHKKITEKYIFSKSPSRLFPDLVFFKITFSDSSVPNIKYLRIGDRCFRPSFDLTFFLMRKVKVRICGGTSQNTNLLSFSPEQAKPNLVSLQSSKIEKFGMGEIEFIRHFIADTTLCTIKQKLTNRDITSALFNVRNGNTSFNSIYRYLTAGVPETALFQKPFKIGIENDDKIWKTRESGILYLKHLAPDKRRNIYFHEISRPKTSKEDFLLSKSSIIDVQNTSNLTRLLWKPEISSRTSRILSRNLRHLKHICFLRAIGLSDRPDFIIFDILNKQKSNMNILNANKDSEVEKNISCDVFFPLKNLNLHYVNSCEGAEINPVEVNYKGKTIFGSGQDIVLRKSVISVSKNTYNNIEHGVHENASKGSTRFLPEKKNSYAVSVGDINTIVNKVYRLLETKLLIEKERRGLG